MKPIFCRFSRLEHSAGGPPVRLSQIVRGIARASRARRSRRAVLIQTVSFTDTPIGI